MWKKFTRGILAGPKTGPPWDTPFSHGGPSEIELMPRTRNARFRSGFARSDLTVF
jgi:hypothetical protein